MTMPTITIPRELAVEIHNLMLGFSLSARTEGLPARGDAERLQAQLREMLVNDPQAPVIDFPG